MLDTSGYKYTLRLNAYCFSTVTMAARTRLGVRLYVHCLSKVEERDGTLAVLPRLIQQFAKRLSGSCENDRCQCIYGVLKTYPTNILLVGGKWISSAGALL